MEKLRICITGAAGNLGSLTAKYLINESNHNLNLMYHNKEIDNELRNNQRVNCHRVDLGNIESIKKCIDGCDVVVHYAGKLFYGNPGKFLPTTNIEYFKNLLESCKTKGVKKIILISFPHVEGETTIEKPSTNRLDGIPNSWHAKTRLEEEKILINNFNNGIVLRVGMVYGSGILMPDGAKWFAKRWLLGVWKKKTLIHLISKDDYLSALKSAIENNNAKGIYNIGDDGEQTLQEYLDVACEKWGYKKPWRMPEIMIFTAAAMFEMISLIFKVKSPLTRDFIKIGMTSYYGDTTRMKNDLLPKLKYPTMYDGIETF